MHLMKLAYDRETGWGNTLLQLSDFVCHCLREDKIPHLPEPIQCVDGITISTDPTEEEYMANIFFNNMCMQYVHPAFRAFVIPTPDIRKRVTHQSHGCNIGLHIRRGNYGSDSKTLDDGTPHEHAAWFCDDTALDMFMKIIEDASENVFVATDSMELRKHLLEKFGDKIKMSDITNVVHSRRCDERDNTDMYVDWFLLSQCKNIYITAGIPWQFKGFSTYGYTAAIYGHSNVNFIFNAQPQSS